MRRPDPAAFAAAGGALMFLGADSAVSAVLAWVGLALMLVAGRKTTRALRG
jgi:hypothetical protein